MLLRLANPVQTIWVDQRPCCLAGTFDFEALRLPVGVNLGLVGVGDRLENRLTSGDFGIGIVFLAFLTAGWRAVITARLTAPYRARLLHLAQLRQEIAILLLLQAAVAVRR